MNAAAHNMRMAPATQSATNWGTVPTMPRGPFSVAGFPARGLFEGRLWCGVARTSSTSKQDYFSNNLHSHLCAFDLVRPYTLRVLANSVGLRLSARFRRSIEIFLSGFPLRGESPRK